MFSEFLNKIIKIQAKNKNGRLRFKRNVKAKPKPIVCETIDPKVNTSVIFVKFLFNKRDFFCSLFIRCSSELVILTALLLGIMASFFSKII